jgi:hypothetical protein
MLDEWPIYAVSFYQLLLLNICMVGKLYNVC